MSVTAIITIHGWNPDRSSRTIFDTTVTASDTDAIFTAAKLMLGAMAAANPVHSFTLENVDMDQSNDKPHAISITLDGSEFNLTTWGEHFRMGHQKDRDEFSGMRRQLREWQNGTLKRGAGRNSLGRPMARRG